VDEAIQTSAGNSRRPNVSIGILARNATKTISIMLQSLFGQSLLTEARAEGWTIEVVVVANACTDSTVKTTRSRLGSLAAALGEAVVVRTVDIREPGKSNAWNRFVHEFSDPDAEYLVLLDADIEFNEPDTLKNMVLALTSDERARVSVDQPLKDISRYARRSLRNSMWLRAGGAHKGEDVYICGQAYCARASFMRTVWLPAGLPSEDGFVRTMVVTDRYTTESEPRRVVRAPGASHYFEAITSVTELLKHERRMNVGVSINVLLDVYLRSECGPRRDAGTFIRDRNSENPHWLRDYLAECSGRSRWLVPSWGFTRRFNQLRDLSPPAQFGKLPVVLAGATIDACTFLQANSMLRDGSAYGHW
jgi:glycosyltransferase involved in cell wall biosynthesis